VRRVARFDTTQPVMDFENHRTLLECTGIRVPMHRLWSESKNFS
jgi:hypothetical protein